MNVDPAKVCDRPGCGQPWPVWRQTREPGGPYINPTRQRRPSAKRGPYINPTRQRRPGAKRGNRCYCSPDCADQDNP